MSCALTAKCVSHSLRVFANPSSSFLEFSLLNIAKIRGFKIYTKTGDKGKTSLYSGERVLKTDERFEALGSVDELSSWIGLCRVLATQQEELKHENFVKVI